MKHTVVKRTLAGLLALTIVGGALPSVEIGNVKLLDTAVTAKADNDLEGNGTEAGQVAGGWEFTQGGVAPSNNEAAVAALEKATLDIDGIAYTPVAVLGTQAVAGTNYAILCKVKAVAPEAKAQYQIIYVYEDLEGTAKIIGIKHIIGGETAPGSFEANDGDPYYNEDENKAIFEAYNSAYEDLAGVDHRAIAYLGSQVVNGTNYLFLSKSTPVVSDPKSTLRFTTIYVDTDGKAQVDSHAKIELGEMDEELHEPTITHFEAEEPTCTEVGHVEYWYNDEINKAYLDEALTQEVKNLLQLVIPALEHDLDEPVWTWSEDNTSAHVTVTCKRCKENVVDADAEITVKRVEPTYEKEGSVTYTATAKIDDQTLTDTKTVVLDKLEKVTHREAEEPTCTSAGNVEYWIDNVNSKVYTDEALTQEVTNIMQLWIPSLGHDLEEPVWTWSEDNSTAHVTITCKRCKEKVLDTDAKVSVKRIEPTADTAGSVTYTAAIIWNGEYYVDTKFEVLPKQSITYHPATEPTCTEPGNVEYWVDSENSKIYLDEALTQEVTSLLDLVIPALEHDLDEPEWTWGEDNKTAHVTVTCKRCKEKVVDADAKVTVKRVEPTAEKAGSVTYTAAVMVGGEYYVDTKVEVLDKLSASNMPVITFERGDFRVKLNWTASEGATRYAVCGYVNKTWKILAQGNDTSYILTKLTPGVNYKVAVIPMIDGAWKMDFSNAITVTPNSIRVPKITVEQGENDIKLDWTEVEGAEKYGICGVVSGKWTLLDEGFNTSYILKNLKPGTKYTVAVIAKINGKWVKDYSNQVEVTTKTPVMPTVSYEKGKNAVKLTWTEYEGAEKYAVCGYSSGKWTKLAEGTGTSYIMNNLKTGSTYKVAVTVKVNGRWKVDYSNAIEVAPLDQRVLEYPEVKSQAYKDKFILKWSAVKNAEGYALAAKQSGKWTIKKQFDANTTTFTSPSMSKGDYRMVIIAKVDGKWQTNDADNRAITVSIF